MKDLEAAKKALDDLKVEKDHLAETKAKEIEELTAVCTVFLIWNYFVIVARVKSRGEFFCVGFGFFGVF